MKVLFEATAVGVRGMQELVNFINLSCRQCQNAATYDKIFVYSTLDEMKKSHKRVLIRLRQSCRLC